MDASTIIIKFMYRATFSCSIIISDSIKGNKITFLLIFDSLKIVIRMYRCKAIRNHHPTIFWCATRSDLAARSVLVKDPNMSINNTVSPKKKLFPSEKRPARGDGS